MGGNTYHRKFFTKEQIFNLVQLSVENPLKSLFESRVFSNEKSWRANISRYLDNESCIEFYYLLETLRGITKCCGCQMPLTKNEFNNTKKYKFNKFCSDCTRKKVWLFSEYLGSERLAAKGKIISKAKLQFYKTKKGKNVAKRVGKINSHKMKLFAQTPRGIENRKKSKILNRDLIREKILSGKFTPNSNNRNTHWNSSYNGKKFRSSWEALYQYFYPEDLHENLRIKYLYLGEEFVYIVDFINYNDKTVTEVKPKEMLCQPKFIAKKTALESWAKENGFTVRIADLQFLISHPIPKTFDLFDKATTQKILNIYGKTTNQKDNKRET